MTTPSAWSILSVKGAAVSRFQSLRDKIVSVATPKETTLFPPQSWAIEDAQNAESNAAKDWSTAQWIEQVETIQKQLADTPPAESPAESDPSTLAARIRSFLSTPSPETSATTPTGSDKGKAKATPTPAPVPAGVDTKFAGLLSTEAIMNGAGKGKDSVWSILQQIGPWKKSEPTSSKADNELEALAENDGIMVYAPLQPDTDSTLELADCDIVVEPDNEHDPKSGKGNQAVKEHREWRPSSTKISLQAEWWGFRLYLPPPIIATLSDAQLATAKRGAMITASLKWALDKIPILMVPPQFRPALMVLKKLSPYVGYLGAFVAWSFEKIKKRDKGNGVILTATWVLPLALVPATWDPAVHGQPNPSETPVAPKSTATKEETTKAKPEEKQDK